jgi:hypothetical protein
VPMIAYTGGPMSDLTDEMRQLASDGATYARPLAAAEVIRRGNRRHTRTIAQRSIGGLSAVGLGAAVLFTGVTHHPASNPAASGAAAAGRTVTVTVTTSSAAGTISMQIKYRNLPTKKIKVESLTYSGDSKRTVKNATLIFAFGPGLNPGNPSPLPILFFLSLPPNHGHHFSGSIPAKFLRTVDKNGLLPVNGAARIELENIKAGWQPVGNKTEPILNAAVILSS